MRSQAGELKLKLTALATVALWVELDLAAVWLEVFRISRLCLLLPVRLFCQGERAPWCVRGKITLYDLSHRIFLFRVQAGWNEH